MSLELNDEGRAPVEERALTKISELIEVVVALRKRCRELEDELLESRRMARLGAVISRLEGENDRLFRRLLRSKRRRADLEDRCTKLQNQRDALEELRRKGW